MGMSLDFKELGAQLLNEARGQLPLEVAPKRTALRIDQVEMFAGPGDGDIEEAAFLLQVLALFHTAEGGEHPFAEHHDEYDVVLQPLGLVDR